MSGRAWCCSPRRRCGTPSNPKIPVPIQLLGVYPTITANTIGTLGVLVVFWSAYRIRHRLLRPIFVGLGLVSLLGAQYRTGYLLTAAGLLVVLVLKRRFEVLLVAGLAAMFAIICNPHLIAELTPWVLRGETVDQARGLSDRVSFWNAGLAAWHRSPLLGLGLLTGTRFEVLAKLGLNETSTIHGTWPEALIGTGIIGVTVLALAYLIMLARALRSGQQWLIVLAVLLGIRSITGQTFEAFNLGSLLFVWLGLQAAEHARHRPALRAPS